MTPEQRKERARKAGLASAKVRRKKRVVVWTSGKLFHNKFAAAGVGADATICVDAKGRVITHGAGFLRARDEGAFPVEVYRVTDR